MTLDPRLTPARPDLAALHLRGRVEAARFVEGATRRVIAGAAPLRGAPRPDAAYLTEALHGDTFTAYDEEEGWSWGQLGSDGYVGWIAGSALFTAGAAPTHRVAALRTYVFPGPSIKLPPLDLLSLNARVAAIRTEGGFAAIEPAGFVHLGHLAPLGEVEADPVAVAERFVGTPYLWGGRTSVGLDCSALVQMSLAACGIAAPRDSDMQRALGTPVADPAPAGLRRGDLVFWKGHVAIARGDGTLIHANAHHMAVAIEDAGEAIARIAHAGLAVAEVRRLASPA